MNFNEFVNEVKDNIRLFLPKDYENAELVTIPGDNHVFDKHLDMVLAAITKFLGEQA